MAAQSVQPMGGDDSSLMVLSSYSVVDASSFHFKDVSPKPQREDVQIASSSFKYANEDFSDLDELQVLRLEGVDRQDRLMVRIVGKFLPVMAIDRGRLKAYITDKLVKEVKNATYSIVYFHTRVDRGDNSPGMLYMRQIYENLPHALLQQLAAIYAVLLG